VVDGLAINWGLDVIGASFGFNANLPISGEINSFPRVFPRLEGENTHIEEEGQGMGWGTYLEAEIGPFAGVKVVPGFRFDLFELQHSYNVSATPRLAVRYDLFPGTTLKAAYGVYEAMSQPETRLKNLGNPSLWPQRSRHHIVGVEQQLTPAIKVDFQLFYNRKNQLVVPSSRILSVEGGVVELEQYSNDGIGGAYGAELMARHELSKNLFGWISYTLMRSEARTKPKQPWQLTSFDQTHILTVVGQYKVPWHLPFREWGRLGRLPRGLLWNTGWAILSGDWSFGARFRLVSGNPDTPIVSATHDLDTDTFSPKSGGLNTSRLPTFHQLDLRVDYKMAFDNLLVNLYLDAINVYNRKNAETMAWDYRYRESVPLALLPFLPVMGMSAEF
jgi:outer membrane receptor protein involved in Fe transport